MNDNIIKIGDYFFRILNKINYNERQIVNIYSSKFKQELIKPDSEINFNKVNKFSVYLSNSDLGCFRLCLYYMGSGKYHKGNEDYIQQTFIHVELQKFIHERLDKLVESNEKCYCMVKPNSEYNYEDNEIYYLNDKEWNKINNHIDLISRKIRKEPFKEYSKNKCGQDKDKKFTDVNNELNIFSQKLSSLYQYENNKFISNITMNDLENIYNMQFYKVELKLKEQEREQDDDIILYYCNAKITKFMNKTSKPYPIYINLPIFLTTKEGDKITEFGTFNKYIIAGNYICKAFDYSKQCSKDDPNREEVNYCFNEYVLIGERYNNIFPLLEINNLFDETTWKENLDNLEIKEQLLQQTTDKEELEREEEYNYEQLKELLAREEKEERDKVLARQRQEESDHKYALSLIGGIRIINDRCNTTIKNINDSNCNLKLHKIQKIQNGRDELIEDTERFFNKKINKKLIL